MEVRDESVKVPRMVTIPEACKEIGLSKYTLARMCKEDAVIYIRTGRRYLLNLDSIIRYLETGIKQGGAV